MPRRYIAPPSAETKSAQLPLLLGDEPPHPLPAPAPASPIAITAESSNQLDDLHSAISAALVPVDDETQVGDEDAFHPTEGQLEHAFLVHQADKYQERCLRALTIFFVAASLTIFAKAGLPISEVVLEKYGLPATDNTRLLQGMLGAITVICGFVVVYFALRIRQHSPQRNLGVIVRSSLEGQLAGGMLVIAVVLLTAMFAVVVYLSFTDVIFMVTYLFNHNTYTLDGWDFKLMPPN